MLTLKSWKDFCLVQIIGGVLFLIPILFFALLFTSGFFYIGHNTTSIFHVISRSLPLLVFFSAMKIICLTALFCYLLQILSFSFSYKWKLVFGFVFFLSLIFRVICYYPALSNQWYIIHKSKHLQQLVEIISMFPEHSWKRYFINGLPFFICLLVFLINFFIMMYNLVQKGKLVENVRNSIYIEELESESKAFSIQGILFLFFLFGSLISLTFLNPSLKLKIPVRTFQSEHPNVFIFAIDSLRFDRLSEEKYANVMPFLRKKLKESVFFKPMIVGVPSSLPSWAELVTGHYAMRSGVRTMFPLRSVRLSKQETLFTAARKKGYSTLIVSDSSGDIFQRYPFGAEITDAPNSDLISLVENRMMNFLVPIQAVLTLPNLQRLFPPILGNKELSEPHLLASAFGKDLDQVAELEKPIFATLYFSTASYLDDKLRGEDKVTLKNKTIAQYDSYLKSIDETLKDVYAALDKNGWLKNSFLVFMGDHGVNLYDEGLGVGHGESVQGEYSTTTPLIFLSSLKEKQNFQFDNNNHPFVRNIDLAPTLFDILQLGKLNLSFDGSALFNDTISSVNPTNHPSFPRNRAYIESGLWYKGSTTTQTGQERIYYPNLIDVLDIDKSFNFEFNIRPDYIQTIPSVKERAWLKGNYKLIVRTTKFGVEPALYLRNDSNLTHNLITEKKYKKVASEMFEELNRYVEEMGVEIVPISKNRFIYAENLAQ